MKKSDQINIFLKLGSEMRSIFDSFAEKYTNLGVPYSTVARNLFVQRLQLVRAGWVYEDNDTGHLLALCVSNSNPPSGGTLAQLRKYAVSKGAEEGQEDSWLKEDNVVPDMLRIGLSLAHAGLELDDKNALETLLNVAHNPHLLAAVSILTNMPKERLLKVVDAMEREAAAG